MELNMSKDRKKSKKNGRFVRTTSVEKGFRSGFWEVLKTTDAGRIPCLCHGCGRQKDVYKSSIISQTSKSCGCQKQKLREKTSVEMYGHKNPAQSEIIKNKMKETNFQKRGVEYALASEEVKKKRKFTNLAKYGVESITQSSIFKEKTKETLLEKYGVEQPSHSFELRQRQIQGMIDKYGTPHSMQVPELREKARQTLEKTGKIKTSKQQKEVYNLLKEARYSVKLNKNIYGYSVDVFCKAGERGVVIEYDGGGHFAWEPEEVIRERDNLRDKRLLKGGYSVLRIESKKDRVPTIEQLKEAVEKLSLERGSFVQINLD